jgi:hypothetical protein
MEILEVKMNDKHKKLQIAGKLICAIISILLLTSIPASAQPNNFEAKNPQNVIAELYAKRFGVTMDEALHRLALQDSFPGLSTALENSEKETYGGLWIQHEPEYKIAVAFTNSGEQTISKYSIYISEEVAPYIQIRNVKKSLAELLYDQERLFSSMVEQGIKAESRVDIINNCVSVDITKADEAKFNIAMQNQKLAIPEGLKVTFVDGLSVLTTDIYGGLWLDLTWPWFCTSGFAVKNSAGTKGISTACHAGTGSMYYSGVSLVWQFGINGGAYDCQWRTCSGLTVKNQIQWYTGDLTAEVTAKKTRSEQHVGDIVSKYGQKTYYTAGQITSTSAILDSPYNSPTWIEVSNIYGYPKMAEEGDSGGPWFIWNDTGVTALGITNSVSDDRQKAYYMAENYIEDMGVYVMTSP